MESCVPLSLDASVGCLQLSHLAQLSPFISSPKYANNSFRRHLSVDNTYDYSADMTSKTFKIDN
jgi:hypothetical protein